MSTNQTIKVLPANEVTCAAIQTIFGTRGYAAECQCQRFKMNASDWDREKNSMRRLDFSLRTESPQVQKRMRLLQTQARCGDFNAIHTSGLIAYLEDEPAGWCAVEPRVAFPRLLRKTMVWKYRKEDKADETVWAVTCLITRAGFRRKGITYALVRGAVEFAENRGAKSIEAYPMIVGEGEKIVWGELHVGNRKVFEEAGFVQVSQPSKKRVVMRIDF